MSAYVSYMMNYLWLILIVFSFAVSLINGTADTFSDAVFTAPVSAVELVLKLCGGLCLWSGIMNVARESGLCSLITRLLKPLLRLLFRENKNDAKVLEAISMNITANLLGLGNAATPLGMEAVRRMQQKNANKQSVTVDMMTFVVMNTAALKLLPTTVATLRATAGAVSPMDIIVPVWLSSLCSVTAAVLCVKLIGGRFGK